jgi:hypothetical protein
MAYASVPGWCAYNRYAIPDWYYGNGCYVGPVFSAGYCDAYAVPVYNTFYNRGSRYNYWNSRAYVYHNATGFTNRTHNIHRTHGGSLATGTRHPIPEVGHAAALTAKHHDQAAGLKHSLHPAAKRNAALSIKQPKASRSQPRTAQHSPQPKSFAHSQSPAQRTYAVHAQPHHQPPRQMAHAQAHPQHVAHAQTHSQSGYARRK